MTVKNGRMFIDPKKKIVCIREINPDTTIIKKKLDFVSIPDVIPIDTKHRIKDIYVRAPNNLFDPKNKIVCFRDKKID